jgi:hypothetical protein
MDKVYGVVVARPTVFVPGARPHHNELTQYHVFAAPFCPMSEDKKYSPEWYLHRAVRKITGVFHSMFWESLVLQASSRERARLPAVLSLSSAHKQGILNSPTSNDKNFRLSSLRCNNVAKRSDVYDLFSQHRHESQHMLLCSSV